VSGLPFERPAFGNERAVADQGPPAAGRLVVLVTEPMDDAAAATVKELTTPDGDVVVVAPSISSPIRYWTQDVSARERAGKRLEESLAALREAGVHAVGEIGDDDPLLALEDAVAVHRPSGAVVVTPPPDRRGWLEHGLVPAARQRVRVPVTHATIGGGIVRPEDEQLPVRQHPRRDAAIVIVLAFLATFGSIVTFFMLSRSVSYGVLLVWAIFADVVPKALFAWAGWRLYLKRRHREPPGVAGRHPVRARPDPRRPR
jgi:hypothetical protein